MSILCTESVFRHTTRMNGLELGHLLGLSHCMIFFVRIAQNGIPFRVFNSPAQGDAVITATFLYSTVMILQSYKRMVLKLGSLYATARINT
jgi:hypothetical protein